MGNDSVVSEFPDKDQRAAVCFSQWKEHKMAAQPELPIGPKLFSSYSGAGVENDHPDILKGVVVCEVGEAKGHGFFLTSSFLDQVVNICAGNSVKVRVDHPEPGKSGKLLSIVGEAFNFRKEGDKVRADIKLFDVPAKQIIQSLAKEASNLFGMSLDFMGKAGKKLKNGLREMACKAVNAVDFVESPAATTSLFNTLVDSSEINSMNINLPTKFVEQLELGETPDEKAVLAALEGMYEKSVKYAELKKQMDEKSEEDKEEMDDKEDKKEEKKDDKKMEDKEDDKKEEKKEEMSKEDLQKEIKRLAAQEVTLLLAKIGSAAQFSNPDGKKEEGEKTIKLSDEQKAIAKQLGLDEKAYAEALQKNEGLKLFHI